MVKDIMRYPDISLFQLQLLFRFRIPDIIQHIGSKDTVRDNILQGKHRPVALAYRLRKSGIRQNPVKFPWKPAILPYLPSGTGRQQKSRAAAAF